MRKAEAVATFEQARLKARRSTTWGLKIRIWRVGRRVARHRREVDQIRKIAFCDELNHRSRGAATLRRLA